jgi:hypothetical protein
MFTDVLTGMKLLFMISQFSVLTVFYRFSLWNIDSPLSVFYTDGFIETVVLYNFLIALLIGIEHGDISIDILVAENSHCVISLAFDWLYQSHVTFTESQSKSAQQCLQPIIGARLGSALSLAYFILTL